jgi:hypothetical protein
MTNGAWVKSSRSGSQGNCVEVRRSDDDIQVRDSKDPDGPVLTFTHAEWDVFIISTRAGGFDL